MEIGIFSVILGCALALLFFITAFFSGVLSVFFFLIAAVFYNFTYPGMFSVWHLAAFTIGIVFLALLEFLGSYAGAKLGKASPYGFWGSVIGSVIGFFGGAVVGSLVGAFLGCLFGEVVFASKTMKEASKAGFVITLGIIVGAVVRTLICFGFGVFFILKLVNFPSEVF